MFLFITIFSITGNDISQILDKKPTERDVVELLAKYGHQYESFATALGVGITFADRLSGNNINRLTRVIARWMSTQCSPVTWRTIIKVVESKTLGENVTLANEIRTWLAKDEHFTYYMNKDN